MIAPEPPTAVAPRRPSAGARARRRASRRRPQRSRPNPSPPTPPSRSARRPSRSPPMPPRIAADRAERRRSAASPPRAGAEPSPPLPQPPRQPEPEAAAPSRPHRRRRAADLADRRPRLRHRPGHERPRRRTALAGRRDRAPPPRRRPAAPPQWPARPSGPQPQPPSLLDRATAQSAATEALWAASARDVVAQIRDGPVGGVQPCSNCGLSLSATARFCRRCGTRQGG